VQRLFRKLGELIMNAVKLETGQQKFKSSLKCILKNKLIHKMNRTNRKPKAY